LRLALFAAAIALAAPALAADRKNRQVRKTGDLVVVCDTNPSAPDYATAIAFSHGVLVGAYGFFEVSTPAEARFICPPSPRPTRAEVLKGFVAWSKAHPQYIDNHSVDTLFRYLGESYPCKK
jgi:hypothetical protein